MIDLRTSQSFVVLLLSSRDFQDCLVSATCQDMLSANKDWSHLVRGPLTRVADRDSASSAFRIL